MEFSTTAFLVLFAVFLPVAYCIRYAAAAWCYEMAMKPSKRRLLTVIDATAASALSAAGWWLIGVPYLFYPLVVAAAFLYWNDQKHQEKETT
tara:strand:- start:42790 stop:43065 length:276 start_codon:yes stop_codon:yes gene_type:complete